MLAHDQRRDQAALLLGHRDRLDAHRAAALARVVGDRRALAVAVVGHDEQVGVLGDHVHREHPVVAARDVHAAHAARVAAHRPRLRLVEASRLTGVRDHDDVVVAVGAAHGDELVVVADVDRDDAVGLDRRVVGQELRLLDLTLAGGEHEVLALGEVTRRQHRADELALAERQHVDERTTLRGTRRLRQFVHLLPVDLAAVREEQQVIVRRGDEQMLDVVVVLHVHPDDTDAAALLLAVGRQRE